MCARVFVVLALIAVLTGGWDQFATACPLCPGNLGPTLSEQVAQADASVIVAWESGTEPDLERGLPGETTYRVASVLRDVTTQIETDGRVTLDRFHRGQPGDRFLLLGLQDSQIVWTSPLAVSDAVQEYMRNAPSPKAPAAERLSYFAKFLEHAEPVIADDAFAEFAAAPYTDVAAVAGKVPREQVRGWLADPTTVPMRLGLYGLLLGLAGDAADAKFLERKVLEPTQVYRLGIDGMISGYLLLSGELGLEAIDDAKLRDTEAPLSETYGAMNALRFLWTFESGRIPKDRLRASMRILLDRPELIELAIVDLARWEDWSIGDRLMEMYGAEAYDIPSIKRAIIRYFLVVQRSKPNDAAAPTPEHVQRAERSLADLRQRDPETVKAAERFFFLN